MPGLEGQSLKQCIIAFCSQACSSLQLPRVELLLNDAIIPCSPTGVTA